MSEAMSSAGPPPGGPPPGGPPSDAREKPIGELLKQLSEQTSTLVRQEIELAKAEVTDKGKKAGIGAGFLAGAGLLALLALGALTAFFILLLDGALANWLAALVVTLVYLAIAGVLGLMGKKKLQEAGPPVPEQTVQTVKEDVDVVKTRAKEGRSA